VSGPGRISSLDLLDHELLDRLGTLMIGLRTEGIPLEVFETARSPARQADLYQIGRDPDVPGYGRTVTRAMPYQSAHQYGLGVDLVFRVAGRWTWEEPQRGMWDRFHTHARQAGLTPLSFEAPHVQLPGFDPAALPKGPGDTAGWLRWLRERVGAPPVG
jgi:peptidoglycan L-alanyl-D-glutamate endopeptidase CwlK